MPVFLLEHVHHNTTARAAVGDGCIVGFAMVPDVRKLSVCQ